MSCRGELQKPQVRVSLMLPRHQKPPLGAGGGPCLCLLGLQEASAGAEQFSCAESQLPNISQRVFPALAEEAEPPMMP